MTGTTASFLALLQGPVCPGPCLDYRPEACSAAVQKSVDAGEKISTMHEETFFSSVKGKRKYKRKGSGSTEDEEEDS
jgi:hypothetical protein